jgi:hypothetical protein
MMICMENVDLPLLPFVISCYNHMRRRLRTGLGYNRRLHY